MSIEKLLEDLTEAVKDLTAQIEVLTQGLATIPETALPTSSSTIELPVVELSTDAAASSVASSESAPPQETPPEPKRKRGRPPKAKTAEVEPEAEAPQYETYEDAIRAIKDSFAMETLEARQDLVRHFKQDARKLIDLQPLGDDIWKRVIARVRDMEREAQWKTMTKHAYYSPSSAAGWMNCAQFEKRDGSNPAADWGTACHEVAAWALINGKDVEAFPALTVDVHGTAVEVTEEMREHAAIYAAEVLARKGHSSLAWYEVAVDISRITGEEDASGTADAVLLHTREGEEIEIVDLKTGQKSVSPASKQLRLYALGVYRRLEGAVEPDRIRTTIVQTRHGTVKEHVWEVDELLTFEAEIKEAVARHRAGAEATPVWEACQWCAKRGDCTAFAKFSESEALAQPTPAGAAFTNLDASSVEQMEADVLMRRYENLDLIRLYVKSIEEEVRRRVLLRDAHLPLKPVRGRKGPRVWKNAAKVLQDLKDTFVHQPDLERVTKVSPLSPKQVELFLQEKGYSSMWARFVEEVKQSEGAISIVSADDPRPAVEDTVFEDIDTDT